MYDGGDDEAVFSVEFFTIMAHLGPFRLAGE